MFIPPDMDPETAAELAELADPDGALAWCDQAEWALDIFGEDDFVEMAAADDRPVLYEVTLTFTPDALRDLVQSYVRFARDEEDEEDVAIVEEDFHLFMKQAYAQAAHYGLVPPNFWKQGPA